MLRIAWFLILSLFADDVPVEPEQFTAKQMGNNIELMTPYGPKLLWGDSGFDTQTNYRLEIPIEELKSKEQKELERKQKEAEAAAEAEANREPQQHQVETKIIEKEREIIKEVDREKEKHTERDREKASQEDVQGQPKKIIVEYDETDRFVLEANRLFNRGKFYEASMVVEELLRRKPDFVRGWVMKGSLLHVQGHKDRAKAAWQTAIKLDPDNGEIQRILETYK